MTDLWTAEELEQYMLDGYHDLTLRTGCLWATDVAPDAPAAFSCTAPWELDLLEGGSIVSGCFQFTSEFERDFLDNATGPANHNFHWEFNDGYVEEMGITVEVSALVDLPEDLYEIERAAWNTKRVSADRSRHYEAQDSRYELSKGTVEAFIMDKDRLRRLRKWRVPSAAYEPYPVDEDSEEYGILVQIADTEIDDDPPLGGDWGDFVQVAGQHAMGDPWGVIVGIYKETSNLRYEYRRRGTGDCESMEIPLRYQTYVRHYAQARALEREGDGQDLELAAWYQSRYEAGVARMIKRRAAMHYQRKHMLGGGQMRPGRPPRPRLPWTYGDRQAL